jgi:uncharacterized membrane protein YidH (DUF202 family)
MSYLPTAPGAEQESVLSARLDRRWDRLLDRGQRLAIAAAAKPYRTIGAIQLLNVVLIATFVLAGDLFFSDQAEFFRELMPGTWLSFAELLFVAVIAWSMQLAARGERRIRVGNFWGLTAIVFTVFAFDEITQFTVFLSAALTSLGAPAPEGFRDLDAFLLSVLILAAGAGMLRHIGDLLPHRTAIAVLAVGVLLGAASQTLDSVLKSTSGEFVAEESLKLAAEPFLIGGYLIVLQSFLAARRRPGS